MQIKQIKKNWIITFYKKSEEIVDFHENVNTTESFISLLYLKQQT